MHGEQEKPVTDKKHQESTQNDLCDFCAEMPNEKQRTACGSGGWRATIHLWWDAVGSLFIVMYSFLAVLFYIIRFTVSVWDAGARGICGL